MRFPLVAAAAAVAIGSASISPAQETQGPLAVARRLAEWQIANAALTSREAGRHAAETALPAGWEQAAFWIGLTELADRLPADRHLARTILAMGERQGWRPGPRPLHADDQAIGQVYLWAARRGAGRAATQPFRTYVDRIVARPPVVGLAFHDGGTGVECQVRWCWSDALFMAPPGWVALSRQTGDPRYRRYAMAEYRRVVDFLYDPAEKLFYRDSRFFDRRDERGHKLLWGRGNGWVFASLARTLSMLPAGDADRAWLEPLFRDMAARLVALQRPDGYWAPSLLAPEGAPPETSGTGFFTYGLAWGAKAGLLDRTLAEPAARRGWAALVRAIQPDGRLGYVQKVGDRPNAVAANDTQFYGTGAMLLAAVAIADLPPFAKPTPARDRAGR